MKKPVRMFALTDPSGKIITVEHFATYCRLYADDGLGRWHEYYRQGWRVVPVIVRPA